MLAKFKTFLATSLAFALLAVSHGVLADIAIIVNPSNNNTISMNEVARIYMSKTIAYPDGSEAIPLDLPESSSLRDAFLKKVVKKNYQQFKAYWSQLIFTGRGVPPRQIDSQEDIVRLVAENPALIAFVDSRYVDDSVKVIHIVKN